MPGTPGARTGLASVNPTGESPTILRTTINAVISWLEGNAAITSSGMLAARPTSSPGTPGIAGRRYRATDAFATFRDTGTGWELEAQTPQVVTALPTGAGIPFDGQEIILLLDATNGIAAHLRYRAASASAYKWECVGGGYLFSRTDPSVSLLANTGYSNPSSNAPAITLPAGIGGDFEVAHGAQVSASPAGAGYVYQSVASGAVQAVDADAVVSSAASYGSGSRQLRRNGVAAGATITLRHRTDAGASGSWQYRWLSVRPIRVG